MKVALAQDLGRPAFAMQLVATTGELLDGSRDVQHLVEVFSEIFRQE